MKHTLFILGALFAGTFLFAEELDVNGNFMKTNPQDAKQPAGWTKSWSNMKDIGNVTLEKGSADGRNAVRIRTTRLLTPYTSLVEIPVTAGKEITNNIGGTYIPADEQKIRLFSVAHAPSGLRRICSRFKWPGIAGNGFGTVSAVIMNMGTVHQI